MGSVSLESQQLSINSHCLPHSSLSTSSLALSLKSLCLVLPNTAHICDLIKIVLWEEISIDLFQGTLMIIYL